MITFILLLGLSYQAQFQRANSFLTHKRGETLQSNIIGVAYDPETRNVVAASCEGGYFTLLAWPSQTSTGKQAKVLYKHYVPSYTGPLPFPIACYRGQCVFASPAPQLPNLLMISLSDAVPNPSNLLCENQNKVTLELLIHDWLCASIMGVGNQAAASLLFLDIEQSHSSVQIGEEMVPVSLPPGMSSKSIPYHAWLLIILHHTAISICFICYDMHTLAQAGPTD